MPGSKFAVDDLEWLHAVSFKETQIAGYKLSVLELLMMLRNSTGGW
jgi:hypothetical protein